MLVLGIETSCDETAAAVVNERGGVLSNVIHSQIELHAKYGGIIPELASRDHMVNVEPVVQAALQQAAVSLDAIDGIAVTYRPGLVGALLVGVQVAKGLAWATDKPFVGVDHLVGHILSPFLWDKRHSDTPSARSETHFPVPPGGMPKSVPTFPFLALLVSGGHTAIYRVDGPYAEQIRELGATRDDAAGETYDKVGKLLGLGYPGGPVIDRLAHEACERGAPVRLFKAANVGGLEFSFSGLKSQVARHIEANGIPGELSQLQALCKHFQSVVVDNLLCKLFSAAEQENVPRLVLTGGVSANRALRAGLLEHAKNRGFDAFVPEHAFCTDNAAMIGYAGCLRLLRGERDESTLRVQNRTIVPRVTRKGGGRREPAAP